MQQRINRVSSSVLVAATVGGIIWVSAGDLNPPAGPVVPTMKTLAEVEPRIAINATNTPGDASSMFKITQPGSYYLTGNVIGVVNTHGLTIEADDVTVDLAGYALIGEGGTGGSGILINFRSNVEIRNGTIRDFAANGIASFPGDAHRIIGVRAVSNGAYGIFLAGQSHLVRDCTAVGNGSCGIGLFNASTAVMGSTVTGNTVYDNGGCGISLDAGCTVIGNTSYHNGTYGIDLFGGSLVDQNTAFLNNQSAGGFVNMSACTTCTFGLNHAP